MKNTFNNKYFELALRLLSGIFFIYTAQSKIMYSAEFAEAIRAYDIIPASYSLIPAIFFPWIEFLCGLLLLSGLYIRSSALLAISLMAIFTMNVLIALLRGLDIDCGCGASIAGITKVSWLKIIENLIIIIILVKIYFSKAIFFALDNIRAKV